MSRFVLVDRDTAYLLLLSVDERLPSDHLARYVVEAERVNSPQHMVRGFYVTTSGNAASTGVRTTRTRLRY